MAVEHTWWKAIRRAHDDGADLAPLIALLRRVDVEIPPEARRLLADVLEQRTLETRVGAKQVFKRIPRELQLQRSVDLVRKVTRKKMLPCEFTVAEMRELFLIEVQQANKRGWNAYALKWSAKRKPSGRMPIKHAVALVANFAGEDHDTLANAAAGKHGALRRWQAKRRPKNGKPEKK